MKIKRKMAIKRRINKKVKMRLLTLLQMMHLKAGRTTTQVRPKSSSERVPPLRHLVYRMEAISRLKSS